MLSGSNVRTARTSNNAILFKAQNVLNRTLRRLLCLTKNSLRKIKLIVNELCEVSKGLEKAERIFNVF